MTEDDHYGLLVRGMLLHFECGDHTFERDGLQEGPCICPECGRRFTLTWNVTVKPTCLVCGQHEPEAGEITCEQCRKALDEDEKDMARIAREWDEFDRDPPGS